MGTELTTPITQKPIKTQVITYVRFNVPHVIDINGVMRIDIPSVNTVYTVEGYNEDGELISSENGSAPWADYNASFKNELRSIYKKVVAHARLIGILDTGVDEDM